MKQLEPDARLNDAGVLEVLTAGETDLFAPLGTFPAPVWKNTGYDYENVQTYSWPLNLVWDNNPLHFATQATAEKMRKAIAAVFPTAAVSIKLDEVRVGPFTWKPVRKISLADEQGEFCSINAGLEANTLSRYPEGWRNSLSRTVMIAYSSARGPRE